jgi:hypothetical protein
LTTPPLADADPYNVLLDGVIAALCGGDSLTAAQKAARASAIRAVVSALRPGDAIQTMLLGQCLMFNALVADAGRDLLHRTSDALKPRARSNLNGLNRTLRQNIDLFLKQRDKPARGEAAVKAAAAKQPGEQPNQPTPRKVETAAIKEPAPEETLPPVRKPTSEEDGTWVFEPHTDWIDETPAMEVARLTAEREASGNGAAASDVAALMWEDRTSQVARVLRILAADTTAPDAERDGEIRIPDVEASG